MYAWTADTALSSTGYPLDLLYKTNQRADVMSKNCTFLIPARNVHLMFFPISGVSVRCL